MTWVKIIQVLPELIMLAKTLVLKREAQSEEPPMKAKELKERIRQIDEAFNEGDSRKLNDAFNSL